MPLPAQGRNSRRPALTSPTRRQSQHARIRAIVKDRILSGAWPPGFQLPFETDLAADFGVSRMTMNKVLTELSRAGLLVRRRKLGTVVAAPRVQAAVMEITDIEAEVRGLGLPYDFSLLTRALRPLTPEEAAAARPGPDDPADALALIGLHWAAGAPFCLEQRLINPAAAPLALTQTFGPENPGAWLLREVPWTTALHRIRAINAGADLARLLQIAPGEACLEIRRRTESSGRWVTLVHQTYPGTQHQLVARFSPTGDHA